MLKMKNWTIVHSPDIRDLPNLIFSRSQNLPACHLFPVHKHSWNQFVYATSGTLVVTVADARFVITPEQAIWVPTGVMHTTGSLNAVEFRNLYVADAPDLGMPSRCTVFSVTPLLRALIVELEDKHRQSEVDYVGKLNALIVAQLQRLKPLSFHLPWPRSPMLQTICESVYANPADERSAEDWGRELGASTRTLNRRFERELGISLRVWRHKLRLFLAIEWLSSGRSVTDIGLALGYASTSAFSYMFRQEMGCAPSQWRPQQGNEAQLQP
ncbi:MAG: helix-turn-helix transcriptional regulator [Acidovorax sp.]|nr:helix-turn-helix transcriptional regulator [Acidovorax sp.]